MCVGECVSCEYVTLLLYCSYFSLGKKLYSNYVPPSLYRCLSTSVSLPPSLYPSISLPLSLYLSLYPSISLPLCLPTPVFTSVSLPFHLSTSVSLPFHLSTSVSLPLHLSTSLSLYPLHLSTSLSPYPSVSVLVTDFMIRVLDSVQLVSSPRRIISLFVRSVVFPVAVETRLLSRSQTILQTVVNQHTTLQLSSVQLRSASCLDVVAQTGPSSTPC